LTAQDAKAASSAPASAQMWQHPGEIARWLLEHGEQPVPPLDITRVGIGQSNITTLIVDARGNEWVMREPPPGAVSGTAHDVEREAGILQSLAPSGIPVPRVIGTGRSPGGTAFLMMNKVDGAALETEDDARALSEQQRLQLGLSVAVTLGRLHRVDPRTLGIRPSSTPYLTRQMRRVTEAWQRHGAASPHHDDWLSVHSRLEDRRPDAPAPVIMHGDFRLSNLLVRSGTIAAVLDWELCALGDALADLAWLLDDWRPPTEAEIVMPSPTRAGGFPDREEMVAVYQELTGFTTDRLDYYRAFSQWRAASLLQGVLARRQAGAMGSHAAVAPERLEHSIAVLLASAASHLDAL